MKNLKELLAQDHSKPGSWAFKHHEFEDAKWWIDAGGFADQEFRLCESESNQWAGKLICEMRNKIDKLIAVVEQAKLMVDVSMNYHGTDVDEQGVHLRRPRLGVGSRPGG